MNNLLARAMKLNKNLDEKCTKYQFKIANTKEEEDSFIKNKEPKEFLTILKLYE